jgi:hypothetical protein
MKDLLIVVPYRNREEHLKEFLENAPKYFDKQNIEYDILICELDQTGDWNAGLCVNSTINFIKDKKYKWLFIHHVDIYPLEGDLNFPNENEYYYNIGDYGSCLMLMDSFLNVGGYSNSFWGWGGEDNDLYKKLSMSGLLQIDKDDWNVKYEKKFQNHLRKFNGKNYANTVKNIFFTEEKNDIKNFDINGSTRDLIKLSENIYKHIVVPKKISPYDYKNDKVILGYLINNKDTNALMAYVKSSMMFSSYEYDVAICIADEEPDSYLIDQLESFGVIVYKHNRKTNDLFIDRYFAYKDFLEKNTQYKKVLHTDVSDVFFQSNPFDHLSDELIISSEDILIKDEEWNSKVIKNIYDISVYEKLKDKEVLCGGVFGGERNVFINFCEKVIEESKNIEVHIHGSDQPIIQKIIYIDDFKVDIKKLESAFCCNLHVYNHYKELFIDKISIYDNGRVFNTNKVKFSIVHQYNRINDIYQRIYKHFVNFFGPI